MGQGKVQSGIELHRNVVTVCLIKRPNVCLA